jgi:hypothetical protein
MLNVAVGHAREEMLLLLLLLLLLVSKAMLRPVLSA